VRVPDNNQARRRLAERILVDSDKNKNRAEGSTIEKRRRLVSSPSAAASEVLIGVTTAVSEPIVSASEVTTDATSEPIVATSEVTTVATSEPIVATSEVVTDATSEPIVATSEVTAVTTSEPIVAASETSEPIVAASKVTAITTSEPIVATSEVTAVAPQPIVAAPAAVAAHPGPAPETGRLTSLLSGASDVAVAAPRLRLPRPGGAKPKLAMDTTEVCFVRTLRDYLRMLIKTRQGEPIRIPYEGFNFYFSDKQIQDMIHEHLRLIQTIEAITFDVTDVSAFVERVLANDGATCAELLAIYDRVDAEGAGA
jgi:cytoskeletal protein RodZ